MAYQTAPVNPDGHRQLRVGCYACWTDDIDVQTVLGGLVADHVFAVADTVLGVLRGGAGAVPRRVKALRNAETLGNLA